MIGYIYKITSTETDDIYIGSTFQSLEERIKSHNNDYKKWLNDKFKYVTSFEIIKYPHKIQLIEEREFESRQAMFELEGQYQKKMKCVNQLIAGRTKQE